MKQYHLLLEDILKNGEIRDDRTGVGTLSVFGRQITFDLQEGFPAITTKKLAFNAVKGELLWFLEGSGDERRLAEITHGTRDGVVTIWTPNAMAPYWKDRAKFEGDLGQIYGKQWRSWNTHKKQWTSSSEYEIVHVDQVKNLIDGLKKDPYSRRHVVSAWNVAELDEMALPPCHIMFQMYVSKDNRLSCHMYQRSQDVGLGAGFNYASYALLTHMIAQVCGFGVGELIVSTGDTHIYMGHIEPLKEQLKREPYPLPKLWLNPEIKDIDKFTMEDIKLIDYQCHPPIKMNMAV
jgi:thymidylate synthase